MKRKLATHETPGPYRPIQQLQRGVNWALRFVLGGVGLLLLAQYRIRWFARTSWRRLRESPLGHYLRAETASPEPAEIRPDAAQSALPVEPPLLTLNTTDSAGKTS